MHKDNNECIFYSLFVEQFLYEPPLPPNDNTVQIFQTSFADSTFFVVGCFMSFLVHMRPVINFNFSCRASQLHKPLGITMDSTICHIALACLSIIKERDRTENYFALLKCA